MPESRTYTFFIYWLPVIFYCLIIFLQSALPSPVNAENSPYINQFLHFTGYGLLGALFLRAFLGSRFKDNTLFIITASICLTGIYAATDELHQYFNRYRIGDINDFFFDMAGACVGIFLYYLLKKYKLWPRITGI